MHDVPAERVSAVRRFNRVYTGRIGVLRQKVYGTPWSLAEARVLYELAQASDPLIARDLARSLALDPGYLSRIVQRFVAKGLLRRHAAKADARRYDLALTAAGRKAFAQLDRASHLETAALLGPLASPAQASMVEAMGRIEALLPPPDMQTMPAVPFVLRAHRPGDIGWVVACHGRVYAHEYGWDETFEALVAQIAARFLHRHDPARERCWIAEQDAQPIGSVFLVRKSSRVAQLRLLIVEPQARGSGVGRQLVRECIDFARAAGYRSVMLWTNRGLDAARHLYEEAGFRLVAEEPHHGFGKDLVGQTFTLDLAQATAQRRRKRAAASARAAVPVEPSGRRPR